MNENLQKRDRSTQVQQEDDIPWKKLRLEMNNNPCLTFNDLPEEIYHEILLFLDWRNLLLVEQLNHSWRFRASQKIYWKRFCEILLNVEIVEETISDWKEIFKELFIQRAPQTMSVFARLCPINDTRSCIVLSENRLQILRACREVPTNQVVKADRPFRWISALHYNLEAIRTTLSLQEQYLQYKDSDIPIKYRLCKRNVRYYELIIEAQKPKNPITKQLITIERCIAIGLAPIDFPEFGYMPGWCENSFGYHSDDGKKFHQNIVRPYGPNFAKFDNQQTKTTTTTTPTPTPTNSQEEMQDNILNQMCVVGCGLELIHRRIFFTLNGKFLGFAFIDVPLNLELYPTIGLDTEALITCNFGLKPFVFDLNIIDNIIANETKNSEILPFKIAGNNTYNDDDDDDGDDDDDDDDDDDGGDEDDNNHLWVNL